ncbi:hypothetical protein BJ742DRAFT_3644 [Cladochytrium replicatum]|nr:hypothetical protein BJ742DRAFT_3644 [Cladochytrium replicatum]
MPVNRFYPFLFPVEVQFNVENGEIASPSVGFHNIPQGALLSLGYASVVTLTNSKYDLDNLRLSAVAKSGSSVHATCLLEDDLVEVTDRILEMHLQEKYNSFSELQTQ